MTSLASSVLFVSLMAVGQNVGLPFGVPPGPDDPALRRVVPAKCLGYISWTATVAPKGSSKHPTEALLAEPGVQRLIRRVDSYITKALVSAGKQLGPDGARFMQFSRKWGAAALYRPAVVFVERVLPGQPEIHGGMVIRYGKSAAALKKGLAALLQRQLQAKMLVKVKVTGQDLFRINPPDNSIPAMTFGVVGQHFVMGFAPGNAKAIIGRLQNKSATAPKWLTRMHQDLAVPRRSSSLYVNLKEIIAMVSGGATEVQTLGFGNIGPIAVVSGFDEQGTVTRALLGIDGKAQGLLDFLNAKALTARELKHIPADSTFAAAVRFDSARFVTKVVETVGKLVPQAEEQTARIFAPLEAVLGFDIRRDLLGNLGDVWSVYHSKSSGGWAGFIGLVPVKNHDKIASVEKKVLERLRDASDREKFFELTTTGYKDKKIHHMTVRLVPVAPCWTLLEDRIVLGLFPQNLRDVIDRKPSDKSLAAGLPAGTFQSNPIVIGRHDGKELFKVAYPLIQLGTVVAFGRKGADPFLLPSGSSISKHLSTGKCIVSRTKRGLELRCTGALPPVLIQLLPAAFFGGRFVVNESDIADAPVDQ